MGEPARGGDARGYSWPPFEPGHTLSMRHGARSPRVVQPLADALAAQLVQVATWCGHPAFAAEVAAWSQAEAQARLLRAWVDEHGLLSEKGGAALSQLDRAEGRAARLRSNLGLNPIAWAKVLASLAAAKSDQASSELEALAAVGREIQSRSEAATAALGPGDTDNDQEVEQ